MSEMKLPFRAWRAMAKMTQQQVADYVGVDRLTYRNWENYRTFPEAPQLIKLSEAFRCSMDAFYFPIDAS